jgi:CelD/BcsL family acetyltransferase involved in cellulose biosynthesis
MELEVIRTLTEWQALEPAWNDLLDRSIVRVPFLRHEFLSAWWTHLGGYGEWPHAALHVVIARESGRLVAAAPLMLSVDLHGSPILAWIGSECMADYLDFLAEPEFLSEFVDLLFERLTGPEAPDWRSMDLYNLQETSPSLPVLQRAASARSLPFLHTVGGTCQFVPLPGDWETYLARLEKKERHEIRRKLRRAEDLPGLRWYFVDPTADLDRAILDMLSLMEQHREKRAVLTPALRAQFTDIMRAGFQAGWLLLAFLEIDGEPAAGYIAMDFDNRLWIYNTGLDNRLRDCSPGFVLLARLLQWAVAEGRAECDFLRGSHGYKSDYGSVSRQVMCVNVRRRADFQNEMDNETLAAGLGAVAIIERGELAAASTAVCEIVTCRMPDETVRRFFCKFGSLAATAGQGHRYGVAYEAQIYDQILTSWPLDVPPLWGAFLDEARQTVGLALEYLDSATSLHQADEFKAGLLAAARWIGRFHRWGQTVPVPAFMRRYDTEFYRTWTQRASRFTRGLHARFPWLPELCERCERRLPAWLPPATIIHGEYQANNLLLFDGRTVTVDWESAALAAGEIDLAGLTWGWDGGLAALCEQEYCIARWPDGTPPDFAGRLTAARIYLYLRWLGDSECKVDLHEQISSLEELLPLAEQFTDFDK